LRLWKKETIWASQKAIAALFACTKQNVSYHMGKIFASGELDRTAVVKEILTTAQSGARGLSEDKVLYYNLDAIISVGYKINSVQATKFRIWSTSILREYMRHGYVVNRNVVSEQKYEDLKRAMGLLENAFNKELLLSSTGLRRMLQRLFLPEQIIHNNHLLDATTIHVIF